MMKTDNRTVFTTAQVEVLNAVAVLKTDEEVRALKQAISRFFAEMADKEFERLYSEGTITDAAMSKWQHEHMRTPY